MPQLRSPLRPALPRAFARPALPLAVATLAALLLTLATLLSAARSLEQAQVGTAGTLAEGAAHLDHLQELRADYLRRTTTVWQVALSTDPAQHKASADALRAQRGDAQRLVDQLLRELPAGEVRATVEHVREVQAGLTRFTERIIDASATDTVEAARIAFTEALPMLYAVVARLDRTVDSLRTQVEARERAALAALEAVRIRFVALALLFGVTLVLAGAWSARIPRAADPSRTEPATAVQAAAPAATPATDATITPGTGGASLALRAASRHLAATQAMAHQFHLLATSTTIEAARSEGDGARYWAVVAAELSKLAERNHAAAGEAALMVDRAIAGLAGDPVDASSGARAQSRPEASLAPATAAGDASLGSASGYRPAA